MDPDHIFVRKTEDLRWRTRLETLSSTGDGNYEVLMAAPLLRELLMGHPSPMNLANREHRMKIRFQVAEEPGLEDIANNPDLILFARGDSMCPGYPFPDYPIKSLTLDQFLSELTMVVKGNAISVRDVIDYTAHAAGGVHFGNPQKGNRAFVEAANQAAALGGLGAAMRSLAAIGRITVDGLQPLVDRVLVDYKAPP
jgi:hypothetical protein